MSNRRNSVRIASFLAVGLVPLFLISCVGGESTTGAGGTTGTGNTSGAAGTTGSGNTSGAAGTMGNAGTMGSGNTSGAAGTTGAAGSTSGGAGTTGEAGTTGTGNTSGAAGTTGEAGRGGTTGNAGTTGRGGTTGMAGRGGTTGMAGTTGAAGRGGTTGTAGTTGAGGSGDACPSGMTAQYGCGKSRTMGFMGCSMSVNVATGYNRRMGMRMWPPIAAYGGQVVQSWTPASGGVWSSFDSAANQYGKPTDIWMQICIFAQQGVTAAEVQTMIKNARAHSTPTTKIWITGQPTYETGHTCSLAGNGGTELTDMRAKEADDPANNVFYAGTFKIDSTKGEVSSDTCHASSAGELTLGDQFIAKFGM